MDDCFGAAVELAEAVHARDHDRLLLVRVQLRAERADRPRAVRVLPRRAVLRHHLAFVPRSRRSSRHDGLDVVDVPARSAGACWVRWDHGRRINTEGWIYDWTTQVFLVAALLHYYYDGFIWKARESSIGKDLGIASGLGSTMVPGALHAARWGLFLVPLFVLPAVGGQQFSEVERAEMLVGVAPSDFLSRSQLAFECLKAERIEEAAVHCEASIAANPGYAPVRSYYGVTLELLRRPEEAKAQYRVALDCPDLGGAHLRAATNLGVLLLLEGKREAARASLDAAAKIGGQGPMQRLYNLARRPEGGPEGRMQVYRVLLEQYPQQIDALYELGTLQYEANLLSEAQQSFSRLVQQVPGSAAALVGLAKVQIAMADYGPARASLQQALQTEPGNAEAAALLRKIGG